MEHLEYDNSKFFRTWVDTKTCNPIQDLLEYKEQLAQQVGYVDETSLKLLELRLITMLQYLEDK